MRTRDDLLLLADLLGIADSDAAAPRIDPDARRRRLTALVRAALMAREAPALYIIEDVHWIDQVSESMLTEFLAVVAQTTSLVIVTYRPEYSGALLQGAEILALEPLVTPKLLCWWRSCSVRTRRSPTCAE